MKLYYYFFILFWFYRIILCNDKKIPFFTKFYENCDPTYKYTMEFVNVTKHQIIGNMFLLNYDFVIHKDLSVPLLLIFNVARCSNQESPDTCIDLRPFKSNQYCTFISSTAEAWSPLMVTTPQFKCPLKKGVYYGRNCTLDMKFFRLFPTGNFFWKIKVTVENAQTKQILQCANTEGKMF